MKSVYLENQHDEFVLDDDTYEAIVRLVQENKMCTSVYRERHPYSEDNPCVGKGICLDHLLQKQSSLTYLGSSGIDTYNRRIYRFVDTKGYVYTTVEDSSNQAERSIVETLAYYGFTPPASVSSRGKQVSFQTYYATLHGDLPSASVIVLSYAQHSEKVKGLFLLYKHGAAKELHKNGDQKILFTRADELVEASKNEQGEYHIGSGVYTSRSESAIYEAISLQESAMYDVTLKLHMKRSEATV